MENKNTTPQQGADKGQAKGQAEGKTWQHQNKSDEQKSKIYSAGELGSSSSTSSKSPATVGNTTDQSDTPGTDHTLMPGDNPDPNTGADSLPENDPNRGTQWNENEKRDDEKLYAKGRDEDANGQNNRPSKEKNQNLEDEDVESDSESVE